MKILTGNEIANSIRSISPTKIAVAYIGENWKTHLTPEIIKNLETVIVSPTEGSNPDGIQSLANTIGWEKVLFLKRLHAKMFIGAKECIIGSANLSDNGLSGTNKTLLEVAIRANTHKEITKIFGDIQSEAESAFQTTLKKKQELAKLRRIYNKRVSAGLSKCSSKKRTFKDIDLYELRNVYLCWWDEEERVSGIKKECDAEVYESNISEWMSLMDDDPVKEGCWFLCWHRDYNNKNTHKDSQIEWMYVHHVFKSCIKKNMGPYTSLAAEVDNEGKPQEPFKLDKNFKMKFKNLINNERYGKLRTAGNNKGEEKNFYVASKEITKLTANFFKELQKNL